MIQCALRMVETQRRGLLKLRRLLALQKVLFRQRQTLLRAFLRWRGRRAARAQWVLVETFNVECPAGSRPGPVSAQRK